MLKGVHLSLLIGPGVPVPAPRAVSESLVSARVNSDRERTGFQLTFSVGKRSPLLTSMLPAGYFAPMVTRIVLTVTMKGLPHVICDGVITRHELSPGNEPGQATLTVTGEDLSVLMDVVEMPFMRFTAMPDNAIVAAVLAKYAPLGIVPAPVPPIFPDVPIPTKRLVTQTGTDRAFIRHLAQNHGYVFYVEPGPAPGANLAYWGPDVRLPVPQPALSTDFDAHSNVDSLSMSMDGLSKKVVVITIYDPVTGRVPIPIPIPNVSVLRPPMGLRPTLPSRVEFPEGFSRLNAVQAAAKALSISFGASDAITASGSLDVQRYGHILRSRMMVGVRGTGLTHDGFYYVNSVTHEISPGSYKQSFRLSRDGLISNTPAVVP